MAGTKPPPGLVYDALIKTRKLLEKAAGLGHPFGDGKDAALPRVSLGPGETMNVLIVQSCPELAALWKRHLVRQGMSVLLARSEQEAMDVLGADAVDMIVLDLMLEEGRGSSLAVADFASYRHPDARVIFVTNNSFFSDGSIFRLSPNACAYLREGTPPEDLAAMVAHYGGERV